MTEPAARRPGFPGYGIATEVDGLLPWSFATERLAAARNFWVVTASAERGPHAMPVWGLWHEERLVFSTGGTSRKARDLAADPRVVVHLESGDEVVVLEGAVQIIDPSEELLAAYAEKYLPVDASVGTWYAVVPRRAYAWRERDYPQSATRFDFQEGLAE